MYEQAINNSFFAYLESQDNLHNPFPKVKDKPGVRLCSYHYKKQQKKKPQKPLYIFKSAGLEKEDHPVTRFSRSRFNFLYGFE